MSVRSIVLADWEVAGLLDGRTKLLLRPVNNQEAQAMSYRDLRPMPDGTVEVQGFHEESGGGLVETAIIVNQPYTQGEPHYFKEAHWIEREGPFAVDRIMYREEFIRIRHLVPEGLWPSGWTHASEMPIQWTRAWVTFHSIGIGTLAISAAATHLSRMGVPNADTDEQRLEAYKAIYARQFGRREDAAWDRNPLVWALWVDQVGVRLPPTERSSIYPEGWQELVK